jgi:hypothetical protein
MQPARVIYEAEKTMTRGDPAAVAAAITLDVATPPDQVLRRPDAEGESGFLVSCHVQARLRVSQYEFEVEENSWIDRSLLTSDTVRWSWFVTPKVGGTQTLILQVRPVVVITDPDASTAPMVTESDASIMELETTIHVAVPWTERPQEIMSRLAAMFKVAEGLIKAITAVVLALGVLFAALGARKWLQRFRRGRGGRNAGAATERGS